MATVSIRQVSRDISYPQREKYAQSCSDRVLKSDSSS